MLLSLLQLSPRKWAESLKDFGHRLPRNRVEHVDLQKAILRERVLEGSVLDRRQGAQHIPGFRCHFTIDGSSEPRPLYQCLGDLGGAEGASGSPALPEPDYSDNVDVLDGHYLVARDSGGEVPAR